MNTSELWMALHSDSCTKHYVGDVCAVDQLPSSTLSSLQRIFIVNTDPHDLPGKHWVCFYLPRVGPIEFFDSLGHPPRHYSPLLEKFIYSHAEEFIYINTPLQSKFSVTCGHFCLYYSLHRCRGMSMDSIIDKFSKDKMINDRMVQRFVHKHFTNMHLKGFGKYICQKCLSPNSL